jgi:hypothetical protein
MPNLRLVMALARLESLDMLLPARRLLLHNAKSTKNISSLYIFRLALLRGLQVYKYKEYLQ